MVTIVVMQARRPQIVESLNFFLAINLRLNLASNTLSKPKSWMGLTKNNTDTIIKQYKNILHNTKEYTITFQTEILITAKTIPEITNKTPNKTTNKTGGHKTQNHNKAGGDRPNINHAVKSMERCTKLTNSYTEVNKMIIEFAFLWLLCKWQKII